jgi:hypothetical protein
MNIMPIVILFDVTLIFAEVKNLGNGGINPYFGSHLTDELTLLVPAFVFGMNWFAFKCVSWATDTDLNFLDFITYKFNQFGSITGLQNVVGTLRRSEKIAAENHYQDLTCSFDKVVLVFITQTLLVGLYCVALSNTHMLALDQLTTSRWVCGIIMQALVLAGKTDAGGGFHSEIPYWVCLEQESSSQESNGKRSIRYMLEGETYPRGISTTQIR